MLNEVCNLRCPYCFANEFVNKDRKEIDLIDFKRVLDFIAQTDREVGLIGGEPTLHSRITDILDLVIKHPGIDKCVIYTNGIELERIAKQLRHQKMSLLVNVNNDQVLTKTQKDKLVAILDELIFEQYKSNRISLGINMYKPNFEYKYIIDLCKRYDLMDVRTSICVPNSPEYKNSSSLKWFRDMKPYVLDFFRAAVTEGIVPRYDCNKMPRCVYTDEEWNWICSVSELAHANNISTNIAEPKATCHPVIDILPDLRVVRCFGMSDYKKLNLFDYKDVREIFQVFYNQTDSYKYMLKVNEECKECDESLARRCTGGCLSYKQAEIQQASSYIDNLVKFQKR
jgi:organic radical activating enzyme